MKSIKLLTASLLLSVSSLSFGGDVVYCPPAKAPVCCDNTGYIFAYGGLAFGHDQEGSIDIPAIIPIGAISTDLSLDTGYILGGGVGVRSSFMNGSRFEFEGIFKSNDFESGSLSNPFFGTISGPLTGDIERTAVLFNVVKEFCYDTFTAYAGAGFGVANTEFNLGVPIPTIGTFGISSSDMSLAYQIKVGVDVPVGECLSIFGEYKALGFGSTDYSLIIPIEADSVLTHNLVFGARIGF